MKKILKRLATGFLAFATIVTALPTTAVHASEKQYWTESAERVGIIEKVMNDGSIGSTFNEGYMKVEGETAYCVDINTNFKNGYKTRADASTRMSYDQISDVALSLEYVKQYAQSHSELDYKQVYLLEQCVVWQRLSVHLGWQCDNVRASYNINPDIKTNIFNPNHNQYQDQEVMREDYSMEFIEQHYELEPKYVSAVQDNSINTVKDVLYDILNTHKPVLRVMGEDKPAAVVKSRLLKLNRCDIDYAIDQYQKQVTKVHNHKAYMLTVLYQAKSQGELDISNRVMYDFYGAGSKAGDAGGGGSG